MLVEAGTCDLEPEPPGRLKAEPNVFGGATGAENYEIRRAYLALRKAFEPSTLLTAATVDLLDDVRLVIEVLDEAYEILREPHRRERYRRAIEAGPP
ncbi:hypothetical protein [Sorangium sp. So ce1389]|uniref:hypothetical protein n=1 Tax=Sorangium sp. So ce1389 TaxID=3133336 RepID=UPI003F642C22